MDMHRTVLHRVTAVLEMSWNKNSVLKSWKCPGKIEFVLENCLLSWIMSWKILFFVTGRPVQSGSRNLISLGSM